MIDQCGYSRPQVDSVDPQTPPRPTHRCDGEDGRLERVRRDETR